MKDEYVLSPGSMKLLGILAAIGTVTVMGSFGYLIVYLAEHLVWKP